MREKASNLDGEAPLSDKESGAEVIFPDGSRYTGEVVDGKPHGRGVQVWQDASRYEGTFKNGLPDGSGLWNSSDGSSYQGDVKANEFHGAGTYVWPDGSSYIGHYVRGKRHGRGLYRWADGSSYDGDFKGDHRHGYGLRTFLAGDHYEGDYVRDKAHGVGARHLSNGDFYTGGYFNNKRHGYGTYKHSDGTLYKGFFLNGRRHGKGNVTLSDGLELSGSFMNGHPVGELAKKLRSDSEAVCERRCDLLSATEEAADQFMKSVDCDFLLTQVGSVWAVLTGEFDDRDKQYWSSIREMKEVPVYKYEFLAPSFLLIRGICHYADPSVTSLDPNFILLFNSVFQEFRPFPRRDLERLIIAGGCREIHESDQIALITMMALENATHRRPSATQITQMIEDEKDKAVRVQLRFEKSLASRSLVDRYSNLLPVVKRHWQKLENKRIYAGAIPTTSSRHSNYCQSSLTIGQNDLEAAARGSVSNACSKFLCSGCASTSVDEVYLTCATCLAPVCSDCGSCECREPNAQ